MDRAPAGAVTGPSRSEEAPTAPATPAAPATAAVPEGRTRDPDRSRRAILDAAEALFAARGFEETTMQAVGAAAGVSRGTPAYFFGSKDGLYRAVLERLFADEFAFVAAAQAAAPAGAEAALAATLDAFVDFLTARPSFVRLVEREATSGARVLRTLPAFAEAVAAGRALVAGLLANPAFRPLDPDAVLLDLVALCWFPVAQADTFARALGLDPTDPAFAAARKRHLRGLLLDGLRARPTA